MNFKVSVVVPVFNAERFLEKALISICKQPEVKEIIVVNDGSTDKTSTIIEKLQLENHSVKLFQHKNNANKGRAASRNLGIQNATEDYIAFLDADDYFLEQRFKHDISVFKENGDCEGVYSAIGVYFYRDATSEEKEKYKLTTINEVIEPKELFNKLLSGNHGHFSIDGLTVKRSIFNKVGLFNEELAVAEDTELFYKIALQCKLYTGLIDRPVAIRGIHENNITVNWELYDDVEIKMYESLFYWSCKNKLKSTVIERFLERIWIIRTNKKLGLLSDLTYWFSTMIRAPRVLFSVYLIKYFPLVRNRNNYFPFLKKR